MNSIDKIEPNSDFIRPIIVAPPPIEPLLFQPNVARAALRPIPQWFGWTVIGIIGLVLCVVAWSLLARFDIVVTAPGRLVSVVPPIAIQPLDRAVVSRVHVRPGDFVAKGVTLVTLDHSTTNARRLMTEELVESLQAESMRLKAELDDQATMPVASEASRRQAETLVRRRAERDARRRILAAREERARDLVSSTTAEIELLRQQIERERDLVSRLEKLGRRELVSRDRLVEINDKLRRSSSEMTGLVRQVGNAQEEIEQIAAERQAFENEWRSAVADRISLVSRELTERMRDYQEVRYLASRNEILADEDALVMEVAGATTSSVVSGGDVLIRLLPLTAPLEALLTIPAKDAGWVRAGQTVRVELASLPSQRHGYMTGIVRALAPDIAPETERSGNRGMLAYVSVANPLRQLHDVPASFGLAPGLATSANIRIGERAPIWFLIDSALDRFDGAFLQR